MIEKAPKLVLGGQIKTFEEIMLFVSSTKTFQKIEKEYLYFDKAKYLKVKKISGTVLWSVARYKRKFNSLIHSIVNIKYSYNINKYLQQKLHHLDFNFGAGLQKEQLLSDLDKQNYINNVLMEESIFSSMIEGATTTRVKAKEMLRKSKKPKNKSEQMILNNYKTIQYISQHQDEDISIDKLYEIHRLVTEDTLEKENVGIFRTSNDINVMNELTGEIVHLPPYFEELDSLMASFCDFFNNNPKEDFIHPIVKVVFFIF